MASSPSSPSSSSSPRTPSAAGISPRDDSNPMFPIGCRVEVTGLQSKPYLNGWLGTVIQALPNNRYAVQLDKAWSNPETPGLLNKGPISLKRSNLNDVAARFAATQGGIYSCRVCRKRVERDFIMKCANCRRAHYCSKECQTTDWKQHKKKCNVLRNGRKGKDSDLPSIHGHRDRLLVRCSRVCRFLQLEDGPSAEQEARRILDEFEEAQCHFVYSMLSNTLVIQERSDEALDVLQQGVRLPLGYGEDPVSYASSYKAIACFLMALKNDPQAALEACQKGLTFDPNNDELRDLLSQCRATLDTSTRSDTR